MRQVRDPGRRSRTKGAALTAAAALLAFLPAPALAAVEPDPDPFQPLNRVLFAIHQALDAAVIRPIAIGYKRLTPRPVRTGFRNVLTNLGEPAVAVNDALQGHGKKSVRTLTRFAANTTFGVFGLFDIATGAGLPYHPNDFGVTLARYGVGPGPYLFIPLVGPTTVRDGFGSLVGIGLNPLAYARYTGDKAVGASLLLGPGLDARASEDKDLKALSATATDLYASFRSYYLQNRRAEINGGRIDLHSLPDFDDGSPRAADLSPPPPTKDGFAQP